MTVTMTRFVFIAIPCMALLCCCIAWIAYMQHNSRKAWAPIRIAESSGNIRIDFASDDPSAIAHFYRILRIDSPPLAIDAVAGSSTSTIDDTKDAIEKISKVDSLGRITVFLPPGFPDDDIAPLKGLPCLSHVCFLGDDVTAEGFHHLTGCISIESISLTGLQSLTNEGVRRLTEFSNLLELDLSNSIIPSGAFKDLNKSKTLRNLTLHASNFDLIEIRDLVDMQNLNELDVSNTDIADDDLVYISKIKCLGKINLKRTLVTSNGRNYLRKRCPDLDIEWEPRTPPRLVPR